MKLNLLIAITSFILFTACSEQPDDSGYRLASHPRQFSQTELNATVWELVK